MFEKIQLASLASLLAVSGAVLPNTSLADDHGFFSFGHTESIQVGPRPYYLIDKMSPGPLKRQLEKCADGPFYKSDFSIGHRGGADLMFPEHSRESHVMGARMGAGIQECDVSFHQR
jgi:hypothetical protein